MTEKNSYISRRELLKMGEQARLESELAKKAKDEAHLQSIRDNFERLKNASFPATTILEREVYIRTRGLSLMAFVLAKALGKEASHYAYQGTSVVAGLHEGYFVPRAKQIHQSYDSRTGDSVSITDIAVTVEGAIFDAVHNDLVRRDCVVIGKRLGSIDYYQTSLAAFDNSFSRVVEQTLQ